MIDADTQRRAEEAESLSGNPAFAILLEEVRQDIVSQWLEEQDADKREQLWRQHQATTALEEAIEGRLQALAMEARRAERKK
jgi:hypothetical protein